MQKMPWWIGFPISGGLGLMSAFGPDILPDWLNATLFGLGILFAVWGVSAAALHYRTTWGNRMATVVLMIVAGVAVVGCGGVLTAYGVTQMRTLLNTPKPPRVTSAKADDAAKAAVQTGQDTPEQHTGPEQHTAASERHVPPPSEAANRGDTYHVTVNGDGGTAIGRLDKLIVGNPPIELSLEQQAWVEEQVRAANLSDAEVRVFGEGRSSGAADQLANFLLAKGILNVTRRTGRPIMNGNRNGAVAVHVSNSGGLPVSAGASPVIFVGVDNE